VQQGNTGLIQQLYVSSGNRSIASNRCDVKMKSMLVMAVIVAISTLLVGGLSAVAYLWYLTPNSRDHTD
jgi:hypothetical protein